MNKLVVLEGNDIKAVTERTKCALLRFANGTGAVLMPMKSFLEGEEKKGWEQLKRWVSAASFGAIFLDGFAKAFPQMDKGEVLSWFDGHLDEPDCPLLIVLGGPIEGIEAPVVSSAEELCAKYLA